MNKQPLTRKLNRQFCVAPMMRYTDRHFRYLLRLISTRAMLYTEMYTTGSILARGAELLTFHAAEHPLGVQIGGNEPDEMLHAAMIAQDCGYDEININAGCPSPRVSAGAFGACLMTQPSQLASCISKMRSRLTIPVTVKCRIGVDNQDSYEALHEFICITSQAGCRVFIVHARKALLNGISPKANRRIPKLQYDYVYRLKQDFPDLSIILNGGLDSPEAAHSHLSEGLDGVMLGRAVCNQPLILQAVDRLYYPDDCEDSHVSARNRWEILRDYIAYMDSQMTLGVPFQPMARHLVNFYKQQNGAKRWRQCLSNSLRQVSHPLSELNQLINQYEANHAVDSI